MRIVVNDIAASIGGAITILNQLYDYIVENDKVNHWIFLLGDNYLVPTENIEIRTLPRVKASHKEKIVFDFFKGATYIESLHPDVVLSMQNIITFRLRIPQVVYIHQSIPFQTEKKFSLINRKERSIATIQYIVGAIIKFSAKRASSIIVQTEWMKESVSRKARISSNKIIVARPNVPCIKPNIARFLNNVFFYPTNSEIYKDIDCIVKACNQLNHKGIYNFHVNLTVDKDLVKHQNINCIGRLDKTDMEKAYQQSTLLFPSFIETVGLPLLEARSAKTMIVASNTPFARECINGYENAHFFEPGDHLELAKLMEKIIDGGISLKSVSETINNQSEWEKVYRLVVSCRGMINNDK